MGFWDQTKQFCLSIKVDLKKDQKERSAIRFSDKCLTSFKRKLLLSDWITGRKNCQFTIQSLIQSQSSGISQIFSRTSIKNRLGKNFFLSFQFSVNKIWFFKLHSQFKCPFFCCFSNKYLWFWLIDWSWISYTICVIFFFSEIGWQFQSADRLSISQRQLNLFDFFLIFFMQKVWNW